MRLSNVAHTEQPWRIHELTRDFRLEDVWAFRAPGAGPGDFPTMIAAIDAAGGPEDLPLPVRFLFTARWQLGAILGLDTSDAGFGGRVQSLRDRLPPDLRDRAGGAVSAASRWTSLYELDNECARELANKTAHVVMHLGWVPGPSGEHELRMAALVKPNGLFGLLYMAAIRPFRYLVAYPALTRQWEHAWLRRVRPAPEGMNAKVEAPLLRRNIPSTSAPPARQ